MSVYRPSIYVVYPWYILGISMDIPSFLQPDFSACPCCWSHHGSMRTRVWVIKFLPAGGGALPFAVPQSAFAAAGSVASSSSPCPNVVLLLWQSPHCCCGSRRRRRHSRSRSCRRRQRRQRRRRRWWRCGLLSWRWSVTYSTRTCWRSVCQVSSGMDSRSDIAHS